MGRPGPRRLSHRGRVRTQRIVRLPPRALRVTVIADGVADRVAERVRRGRSLRTRRRVVYQPRGGHRAQRAAAARQQLLREGGRFGAHVAGDEAQPRAG